jgi:bifunctional non-homologous end joining protein LigD
VTLRRPARTKSLDGAPAPKRPGAASADEQVNEQLARYRSMRDFAVTAEPAGDAGDTDNANTADAKAALSRSQPFVIQKHQASRLHYDFRLGWRGVLKSWACAKGPSYVTSDRRLAVQVEDHPIEYGGFEGTIPKGQYGGGTVLLWDQGTWEPQGDVDEGLERGSLKFTLYGKKLQGRWTLVRMGGRAASDLQPNWLLIKEHDGLEHDAAQPGITESEPDSVITGRSLQEIAAAHDHVWTTHGLSDADNRSRLPRARRQHVSTRAATPVKSVANISSKSVLGPEAASRSEESISSIQSSGVLDTAAAWLAGAEFESLPEFIPPQLASMAETVPSGSAWIHELKLDGYRIQAHIQLQKVRRAKGNASRQGCGVTLVTLRTRNGLDWTERMQPLATALAGLPVTSAILDGEVVVLDQQGQGSFRKLQLALKPRTSTRVKHADHPLTFVVFDLLHLDGKNTRPLPLSARRLLLQQVLATSVTKNVLMSAAGQGKADAILQETCASGAEGIVSKRADSPYSSGRGDTWRKSKCIHRQEFVIAGYTRPMHGSSGLGAILLAVYEGDALVYCGRCGTGWGRVESMAVEKRLASLVQAKSQLAEVLETSLTRDVLWVKPDVVCEVQFTAWTDADNGRGALRHASFQGLREDKAALDVVREDLRSVTTAPVRRRRFKPEPRAQTADRSPEQAHVAPPERGAAPAVRTLPKLSHPDKILDAESGVTKQQLAEYFLQVAKVMLPHIERRPVSIVRCPEGVGGSCFFQKHAGKGLPATVASVAVPDTKDEARTQPYIVLNTPASLWSMAQLGAIEVHPWGSTADSLERPDRLIFDLDPDETLPWPIVAGAARTVRELLKELGLNSFVKTTGGKGLHVVVALEPVLRWQQLRDFARGIAAALESQDPSLYLIKMSKAARKGHIFLDWMRNERGATAVAPWSPRARPGMRVALPMDWSELSGVAPVFSVAGLASWQHRLLAPRQGTKSRRGGWDPWAEMKPQKIRATVLEAVLQAPQLTAKKSLRTR